MADIKTVYIFKAKLTDNDFVYLYSMNAKADDENTYLNCVSCDDFVMKTGVVRLALAKELKIDMNEDEWWNHLHEKMFEED